MRYLLFNGSPKKGNTWHVAKLIQKHISEISPDSTFAEIHLSKLQLPFCTDCSLCFRKGHEYCPHHDLVQKTIDAIDQSDGIIFITTTFNMQPTALMKNWMDHLCYVLHRPYFFTKKAIVVSTTAGIGAKSAVKYVGSTLKSMGFNKCSLLPISSNSWNCYVPNQKTRNKCRKLAQQFHDDVSSGKLHAPCLSNLMIYNLFRGMSLHYTANSPYPTQDGTHWTNPVRAYRAYDPAVPLSFYKRIIGKIFYLIGKIAGKKTTVTYSKSHLENRL